MAEQKDLPQPIPISDLPQFAGVDPESISDFFRNGIMSRDKRSQIAPEVWQRLIREKYLPSSGGMSILGGLRPFPLTDLQNMVRIFGRTAIPPQIMDDARKIYGDEKILQKVFLDRIGFCSPEEGKAIIEAIKETRSAQENSPRARIDVPSGLTWDRVTNDFTRKGDTLTGEFMYVVDVLDPQEGPIAYAWPYILVAQTMTSVIARSPGFKAQETKVKDALNAVGGKPWRVVTSYDHSGSRTQLSNIYAFVGK